MTRDPRMDEWLNTTGVKWHYVDEFDLAVIDRKASLQNQARLEPLDDDVVERYAIAAKAGDDFPALLIWNRPQAAPMLLGGNHRTAGFDKAGKETHSVYEVWCDKSTATALMYGDNNRHGLAPSTEERCAQALHLIEADGWKLDKAARCVGTTVTRIQLHRSIANADQRARTLRIERFDRVPKSVRGRLDALADDRVFAEAATLVATASMNQEHVFGFVTRINAAADDKARLGLIDKERKLWRGQNRADTGTTKMPATARNRAMEAVNKLSRCRPSDVADACLDHEQARLLGATLLSGRRQLDEILQHLQTRFPAR